MKSIKRTVQLYLAERGRYPFGVNVHTERIDEFAHIYQAKIVGVPDSYIVIRYMNGHETFYRRDT